MSVMFLRIINVAREANLANHPVDKQKSRELGRSMQIVFSIDSYAQQNQRMLGFFNFLFISVILLGEYSIEHQESQTI
jgi:hypothetical protein